MDKVSEIMIKDLVCCTPVTKIEDSKTIMEKYECNTIPVVNTLEEKKIIGIVSISALSYKADKVVQCMSKDLRVVEEDSTIDECLRLMIVNNIEQIPVVDKQGHLCGIVTEKIILKGGQNSREKSIGHI